MGFVTQERMRGWHEFRSDFGPPGRHPFAFELSWGPERVRDWLDPRSDAFLWQEAEGRIRIGGLCGWTPCRGTLHLQYLRERRVRYVLDLEVDGTPYRYVGDKPNLRLHNLHVTHRMASGTLVEVPSGRLVSTSLALFRWRDLPRLLGSVRPRGSAV